MPFPTDESSLAGHQATCAHALTALTHLARLALHLAAFLFGVAATALTDFTAEALAISAEAGADAVNTSDSSGAFGVVVCFAIAVVVKAIAHFRRGLTPQAAGPLALDTTIHAGATSGFAGANQVFVHLTVAVIILSVAGFKGNGVFVGAVSPLSILTHLTSLAAGSRTSANVAVFARAGLVFAIAIVVDFVSTNLFGRQHFALAGLWPLTVDTDLGTGAACPHVASVGWTRVARANFSIFTRATDIIDLAIAVVVFAIADLFLRLRRGAVAPLSIHAAFGSGSTR